MPVKAHDGTNSPKDYCDCPNSAYEVSTHNILWSMAPMITPIDYLSNDLSMGTWGLISKSIDMTDPSQGRGIECHHVSFTSTFIMPHQPSFALSAVGLVLFTQT